MNKKREEELIETLKTCVDYQSGNINDLITNLQEIGKKVSNNKSIKDISKLYNAIGNEDRLKLIQVLKEKDYCVCELEMILDKSQPSISHHLRALESVGLIKGWKKGKFTHYAVVKEQFDKYLNLINQEFKI